MPKKPSANSRAAWRAVLVAGVIATAVAWSGAGLARTPSAVWVEVAEPYLELHTGPGRGYPVTRVVAQGERVAVVKRRTDWYLLRDDRGRGGWAKRNLMTATLLALAAPAPDEGFQTPDQRAAAQPPAAETALPSAAAANPLTEVAPPAIAAPMVSARRNAFNDGSYPDADNHRWEAGTGGGRRGPSKVLRATLSYLIDENLSFDTTLSQVLDGPRNEDLVLFGFTHTFRPERRFAPFVTLGLGVSRIHQSGSLPADTREVGYAAAGFRYLLQQRLAFRADYRAFSAFSAAGNPKETNEWNVGFVFLF